MLIFKTVSRYLIILFSLPKECELHTKSHCKWWKTPFSVCIKLLSPASGNPSLSIFSPQSIVGFARKNLSVVFALGFYVDSIIILHSCCGSQGWCHPEPLKSGDLASATSHWAPPMRWDCQSTYLHLLCSVSWPHQVSCVLCSHRPQRLLRNSSF